MELFYLAHPCLAQDSRKRQPHCRCDTVWQGSCLLETEVTAFPQAGLGLTLSRDDRAQLSETRHQEGTGGLRVGPPPSSGQLRGLLAPVLLSVKGQIVAIISSTSHDNLLQV